MFIPVQPFVTIITASKGVWLSLLISEDGVGCHYLGSDDGPVIARFFGQARKPLSTAIRYVARGLKSITTNDTRGVLFALVSISSISIGKKGKES